MSPLLVAETGQGTYRETWPQTSVGWDWGLVLLDKPGQLRNILWATDCWPPGSSFPTCAHPASVPAENHALPPHKSLGPA